MSQLPSAGGGEGDWDDRVGERVVVRYRLPSGQLTDAVGHLLGVDGAEPGPDDGSGAAGLVVQTRRGQVRIALTDVVAGKIVPPRPGRPAPPHLAPSIADLERVTARHWAAAETQALGEWVLRASGGFTGRGNSVLVLGDPGMPVPAALDVVRSWYSAQGLPPLASLGVPAQSAFAVAGPPPAAEVVDRLVAHPHVDAAAQHDLRGELDRLGWRAGGGTSGYCLTAPLAAVLAGAPRGLLPGDLVMDVADRPDAAWLATYRYRGNELPAGAMDLLMSAPRQAFFSVRTSGGRTPDGRTPDGRTVAVARGSLAGGWGCVTAVDVDPAFRRRGLATALLQAVARWSVQGGAASVMLQTAVANTAAQRLYLAAGFVVHHRYDYLVPAISPG